MEYLDRLADDGRNSDVNVELRIKILGELKRIMARRKPDLVQKSRVQWVLDGDENSQVFSWYCQLRHLKQQDSLRV